MLSHWLSYFHNMEEQASNQFPTKSGYCTITDDRIILARSGVIGEVAEMLTARSLAPMLVIYSIASLFMFTFAWQSWEFGVPFLGVLFLLLGIRLLLGVLTSLNNSATPVIDRSTITKVKWNPGIPMITKPHFKVYFKDKRGKLMKRLIILKGGLSIDPKEKEVAVQVMKEAGLL